MQKVALFDPTHMMSMGDHVTIGELINGYRKRVH